ncbi:hypothetical protein NLG97_g3493 [Lecanicillium saksenae]|uniref:Uncharacterized protein n=1 Tax=Lecanicillium saksenae TaxID=468837 RepID=A0ACC1QXX6_9HYPO|nr:hypothetical protein NLG97_g3493 [Lecanicillium saksenae]
MPRTRKKFACVALSLRPCLKERTEQLKLTHMRLCPIAQSSFPPPNGISVLVVGSVIGGLSPAGGLARIGCEVRVLERRKEKILGGLDMLPFDQSSATPGLGVFTAASVVGTVVTIWAFIKLKHCDLGHGFTHLTKLSCVFHNLYCVISMCTHAVAATQPTEGLIQSTGATVYLGAVGHWLCAITQCLIFVTIVTFCIALSPAGTGSSRNACLVVAHAMASGVHGLAIVLFAGMIALNRQYESKPSDNSYAALRLLTQLKLSYNTGSASLTFCGFAFTLWKVYNSLHTERKHAKHGAAASGLLLLASILQLLESARTYVVIAFDVAIDHNWAVTIFLAAWLMLGALVVLLFSCWKLRKACSIAPHSTQPNKIEYA